MRIIGTASVMRHGATNYTGVFPDLVDEGLPALKAVAKEIAQRFPKQPIFVSSPADRAIATALHVMKTYGLGWKRESVQIETLLGPLFIYDLKVILAHAERVAGHIKCPLQWHRVWDRFYMESDEFKNGRFCESRLSTKNRFMEFIKKLPALCGAEHHVIAVTHIELVGILTHEWFGVEGDYFGPAEVVHLTILEGGELQAEFRGKTKLVKV